MLTRLMEEKDFPLVAEIDRISFGKDSTRPAENLKMLRNTLPGCAYIAESNGNTVGYTFSKKMGDEAYIGPLGFLPEYQHKGYGSTLIKQSAEYLKQHCKVIGLEVRPLKTWNIALYTSLGFQTTFPTFIYDLKDFSFSPNPIIKVVEVVKADSMAQTYFDTIESWLQTEFALSYKEDLLGILGLHGKVLVAVEKDTPIGFLAHGGFLSPHAWGAVRRRSDQLDIFKALLKTAAASFPAGAMMGVNSRYHNVVALMTELKFNLNFVMNRMLYKGYGGKFFELDDGISLRTWMG